MSPSFTTEAIVVNLQNRGEKDILVTLLTPNHGKIFVKAAGVKSIKSSRGANLQLGNIAKISLRQNNGIYWLSECLATDSFLFHKKKLIQLNLLFYFLEIVKNFTPENESSPKIFFLAKEIITNLSSDHLVPFISRQIDFLEALGFGIPDNIRQNLTLKKYHLVQKDLISYFENILEKPLQSKRLLADNI
ncbi:MAG: DNA repair protein RecO [Patescibacteria group bacterium]